ncbi:helix-turn-helix domain-containing protein [Pseudoalteromonas sp. MMG012]|uniref:helix-turn-helix domain-containing protein n=1 Tax=Pseudoalteromonas sp. MMG012 TaxID=2822686 RepID=UPI001B3A1238|nr:helix-turn-helix domain-containing protein [Pseudoalteromonas sp. MMG012]MBQ4852807.1 helix-turn-helix domain-containing protein [Pseudoalteromonas sp. MMG012]
MTDIKSLPNPNTPEEALAAVTSLRLLADQLERRAVEEAVAQGWTWAQIAQALDITRQAAHKRHAAFINKKET